MKSKVKREASNTGREINEVCESERGREREKRGRRARERDRERNREKERGEIRTRKREGEESMSVLVGKDGRAILQSKVENFSPRASQA